MNRTQALQRVGRQVDDLLDIEDKLVTEDLEFVEEMDDYVGWNNMPQPSQIWRLHQLWSRHFDD